MAPIITWKKSDKFSLFTGFPLLTVSFFFYPYTGRWKNNAHTKDTHLHGTLSLKLFPVKLINDSIQLKLNTGTAGEKKGRALPAHLRLNPPPPHPNVPIPRGENTNMSAISGLFQLYYTAANKL